jgi:hypothetical protein
MAMKDSRERVMNLNGRPTIGLSFIGKAFFFTVPVAGSPAGGSGGKGWLQFGQTSTSMPTITQQFSQRFLSSVMNCDKGAVHY